MPTTSAVHQGTRERKLPSILTLTKDKELNLRSCLKHLTFSDDIVVLDSYSSDRTLEIVREFFRDVLKLAFRGGNW